MLDGIKVGMLAAFSEYPGVKQWRIAKKSLSGIVEQEFFDAIAMAFKKDANKAVALARQDGEHIGALIAHKLVIVDSDGVLHRQIGFTYRRWKRDIEPLQGDKTGCSICSVHGLTRCTNADDWRLQWCEKCWPQVERILRKYRP